MLPVALLAVTIPNNIQATAVPPVGIMAPAQPVFSHGRQPHVLVAQAITPGAGSTVVTSTGNRIDITGGQVSGDGDNLFHSFEAFGLETGHTANFVANPQVQTILGRVQGGDASYIDGTLRVSNSDANLFLLNPAGMLFGHNAQLDLSGSFTATTADRVGFGGDWWGSGAADNASLPGGTPNQFSFGTSGSVVNLGNLAVDAHQDLTLLGSHVVNGGSLSAPGGRVTAAAIQAGQTATLGLGNGLLTLNLQPTLQPTNTASPISALSLPQMLTGGEFIEGNEIAIAPDGSIVLQNTTLPNAPGTLATGGAIDVSGQTGGHIALLGQRVTLSGADLNASGLTAAGTVRVGGGYQGNAPLPNAESTYVSADSVIQVNAEQTGDGGLAVLWADGFTQFDGHIEAQGGNQGGHGGLAEVSGKQTLAFNGTVDLSAPQGQLGQLLLDPTDVVIGNNGADNTELADGTISAGDGAGTFFISASQVEAILDTADVTIAATNGITIDETIDASGNTGVSDLTFTANQIELNRSITLNGGALTFDGPVLLGFNNADTFAANLETAGNIQFTDGINSVNDGEFRRLTVDGDTIDIVGTIGDVRAPTILELSGNNISLMDYANINQADIRATNNLDFSPQQNTTLSGSSVMLRAGNNLNLLAANDLTLDNVQLESSGNVTLGADNLVLSGALFGTPNVQATNDVTLRAQDININANGTLVAGNNLTLEDIDGVTPFAVTLADSSLTANGGDLQILSAANSPADSITVAGSDLSADGNLELLAQTILVTAGSQLLTKGDLTLRADAAPGTVAILDGVAQPTRLEAEGEITLEGDSAINVQALNTPQSVVRSGNNLNLISNGTITANGRFISGGDILAGPGALLFTPVDSAGVISSVGDVSFGSYTGTSLKVEAGGSIQGGDITITGPDTTLSGTDPDIAWLSSGPSVILRAGVVPAVNTPPRSGEFQNTPTLAPGDSVDRAGTTFTASTAIAPGTIEVGDITTADLLDVTGAVVLSAPGSITTGDITTGASFMESVGSVFATAGGDLTTGAITVNGDDSRVALLSDTGNVDVESILSRGRDIQIEAAGTFRATGTFNVTRLVEDTIESTNLPVSLALTRFDADGIRIFYNGATEADPNVGSDRIEIRSAGAQFVVGPDVTGKIDPNEGDFIAPIDAGATAQRNQTYAPRPLPDDTSGATGGITIGAFGTNGFLGVSVQDIPFVEDVEPLDPVANPGTDDVGDPNTPPALATPETDIEVAEEQVDRDGNAFVCAPIDDTLIAQRASRGEDEAPTEVQSVCGQPNVAETILTISDSVFEQSPEQPAPDIAP